MSAIAHVQKIMTIDDHRIFGPQKFLPASSSFFGFSSTPSSRCPIICPIDHASDWLRMRRMISASLYDWPAFQVTSVQEGQPWSGIASYPLPPYIPIDFSLCSFHSFGSAILLCVKTSEIDCSLCRNIICQSASWLQQINIAEYFLV